MEYKLDTDIYDKEIIKGLLEEKKAEFQLIGKEIIINNKSLFFDIIDDYIYEYNHNF